MSQGRDLALVSAALMAAAVASCSNPREDVRLTLCKDMVAVVLGAEPSWLGAETRPRGYQDAIATLAFKSADGGEGQAQCYYKYDAKDDTALTLANPMEAYATSPSRMTIDGRSLTGPDLARAVKRAMEKQGREFVQRARDALQAPR